MANSTIKITFTPFALAGNLNGQNLSIGYFHNTTVNIQETFISMRLMPYYSTTIIDIIGNYIDAILTDYSSLFTVVTDGVDGVLITSLNVNTVFTAPEDNEYYTFEVNNVTVIPDESEPLKVVGLSDDRYLINNPIIATVGSLTNPIYFKVKLTNLTNQKTSTDLIVYPDSNGYSEVGFSSVIKSIFDYPSDAPGYVIPDQIVPNANKVRIQIYYRSFDLDTMTQTPEYLGFEVTKTFIRGGNRTTESNQSLSAMEILTPSAKLPVWDDYETAEYYLDSNNLIRKRLLMDVDASRIQLMRNKGCNEVYVKFANQLGGYSTWLFESHTDNESNNNLGGFVRNNKADDLGNEADNKLTLNAKIPKQFRELASDLIVSPEIYALRDGSFVRCRSVRNSIAYDGIKRSYNVTINLELDYRFNPSLLWSN